MAKKPEFICIGPTRTGTTWLYENLKQHPAVWMPPIKELRYLAEGCVIPSYRLKRLLFNSNWHFAELRSLPLRAFYKALTGKAPLSSLGWALRYSLRPGWSGFSLGWYASLFKSSRDLISGDISPIYYHLPESRIVEIAASHRNLKVIMMVRNPIERVWSTAQKNLTHYGKIPLEEIPVEKFISHFDYVYSRWTPYLSVYRKWSAHISDITIGQFEDLEQNPQKFFTGITSFLGIPAMDLKERLGRKVNSGPGFIIPPEFRDILNRQYRDEIFALAEKGFCPNPAAWLGEEAVCAY